MNDNLNAEELKKIAKDMALLLKEFERKAIQINNVTVESTEKLATTISTSETRFAALSKEGMKAIQENSDQALKNSLDANMGNFRTDLQDIMSGIDEKNRAMEQRFYMMNKQLKYMAWTTLTGVVLASVAGIGFSTWYSLTTKKKAEASLDLFNRIEFAIDVKELINEAGLTSCDGELCYKNPVEQSQERYEKNKNYIIIKKSESH